MVERQERPAVDAGPRPGPAPATLPTPRRRLLDPPANDNGASPGRRLARTVLFVLIGGALAWLLRELLG